MLLEPSSWVDLVYHVLAHIPASSRDASNIFNPDYLKFAAEHWPHSEERGLQPQELLALTTLYRETPDAPSLHGFHQEYDGIESFVATMSTPDADPLRELFRIALWAQSRAGFQEVWAKAFAPLYARHIPAMRASFQVAAEAVEELRHVSVVASLPLSAFGRLVADTVYVGLPEFGVTPEHILIQACHEAVLRTIPGTGDANPRGSSPGFGAHWMREARALSGLARRLVNTPLAAAHATWLSNLRVPLFFARGGVEVPSEPLSVQRWLATWREDAEPTSA